MFLTFSFINIFSKKYQDIKYLKIYIRACTNLTDESLIEIAKSLG